MLYKGYIETRQKQPVEKFKGRTTFKTYEQVKDLPEFAGVLANDTILIDVDDQKQSDILMNIVEELQLNCKVICTSRGRHFLFKNSVIDRCSTHVKSAIGLTVDIKVGCRNSIEVLKFDNKERFVEWDSDDGKYDEVPKWLTPVNYSMNFVGLTEGEGRNDALFRYILTLQSHDFSTEEVRKTIHIINDFVIAEPLSLEELETILRDEAFEKPVFFDGRKSFQFSTFAVYVKTAYHVVKINNQLHIYTNGVYVNDDKEIERVMIKLIPQLRKTQRREVLDYLLLNAPEVKVADANYIPFRNGIYDIAKDELIPFDPSYVITNRIDWDYNPSAYSKVADDMLNRIACNDKEVRALLEECIGYCFYRRNELGKAFILVGDKANGKSTFLDCIKSILGNDNISALELKELGDRFSTSMMFGKLANISDDISDDFLQGDQVALFKKVVTGNRIKAERKGQDPFEFEPYIKLIASANDMPRMKDKTGAVLRRLVIIPFNAQFSKYKADGTVDPDYNPYIKYELNQQESMEYMIQLGLKGLKRVLENNEFSSSSQVQKQIDEYEENNNPILGFLEDCEEDDFQIENEPTKKVYQHYREYCLGSGFQSLGRGEFTKQVNRLLNMESVKKRISKDKSEPVFQKRK